MKDSFKKQAVSGFGWSFLIQGGTQVFNFIISIVLARILMPEEFGLIGMISVFITIGRLLIDNGMSVSLIRNNNVDQLDYSTVFFINLIISIGVYVLIYLAAPFISTFYDQLQLTQIIRVICLVFLINALSIIQSTKLNKNLQFKTQFKLIIPSLAISGLTGIIMARSGYGVWSLVGKELVFAFVATSQLWFYSKWVPSFVIDVKRLKYHFNFGYKLTITGIVNTVVSNLYNVLIGKYYTAAQLGYFTRAQSMQQIPSSFLVNSFNRVSFPLLSQVGDDIVRLKSIYRKLMKQIFLFVAPVLMILAAIATPLFRFLLTEKWLPAVPYFQILIIAGMFLPVIRYNTNICNVRGRSDLVLKLSVFNNVLTLSSALIAVWFGIIALLWSLVSVRVITAVVNAHYSGRLINYSLKEQILDMLPFLAMSVIAASFSFSADYFFLSSFLDLFRILLAMIIGFSIYFVMLLYFQNSALLEFKEIILPMIKRKKR